MTFTTRIFKPAQNRLSKQKLLSTKPRKGFNALAKSTKAADTFEIRGQLKKAVLVCVRHTSTINGNFRNHGQHRKFQHITVSTR